LKEYTPGGVHEKAIELFKGTSKRDLLITFQRGSGGKPEIMIH
jgi:hypothetical protein